MKAFRFSPPPKNVFVRIFTFGCVSNAYIDSILLSHGKIRCCVCIFPLRISLLWIDMSTARRFFLLMYLSFSLLQCYRSFDSLVVGLVCVCLINCRSKCLIGAVWIWQRNWRQQRRHKIGNSKRHHHSRNSLNFKQLQTIQIFVPNGTLPKVCLLFLLLCLKEFCVK